MRRSRSTSRASAQSSALSAWARSAQGQKAAQLWASASMDSPLPSTRPSAVQARGYQRPSNVASAARPTDSPRVRSRAARLSPSPSSSSAKRPAQQERNQPSHTLSPSTRSNPSFQSPLPIRGSAWGPKPRRTQRSSAAYACSRTGARSSVCAAVS